MALSPNLKLTLDGTLTTTARSNLLKIDSLGALLKPENTGSVLVRSLRDITLRPNSDDLGGSGTGGIVSVGDSNSDVDLLDIYSTVVNFNGAALEDFTLDALVTDSWIAPNANIDVSKLGTGTISNTEFSFLSGLTSNVQDQLDAISGSNQLAATWSTADGTTKTIVHGFGTFNVLVQILDADNNYANITVSSVERTDSNTVQLTSTEAPGTNWVVLLAQVQ